MNRVVLKGNVGQEPELKYVGDNKAVCNLSLATSNDFYDQKAGSWSKQEPTWHRLTVWGAQAEKISEAIHKGDTLYVEGKIRNSSYEKDGEKRYTSEVVVNKWFKLSKHAEEETSSEE